ncbi:MAG: hypothetical protein NC410_10450 [Oscillibacter sp.]|nr:hypothetical protein [Oscillibacter sp.]
MTVFEILNFNKELLNRLVSLGFRPDDCKYIDLYAEYERFRQNNEKVTYAVSVLATRYAISERKVYDIIKRFSRDCTPHSA